MIDLMENKVLGPLIRKHVEDGEQKGRSEGRREGKHEGRLDLLQEQLTEKFGALPEWARQWLHAASAEDLRIWAKRILSGTTLEETLL